MESGNILDEIKGLLVSLHDRLDDLEEQIAKSKLPETGGIDLAVKITGLSANTIRIYASNRKIPHSKPSGRLVFNRDELFQWIGERKRFTQNELQEFF